MVNTIVLRFKDGEEPTIQRHLELLSNPDLSRTPAHGIWWGWWKKNDPQELFPKTELTNSAYVAQHSGLMIGLVDREFGQYWMARCSEVRQAGGSLLASPVPELTPSYYRDRLFPAWFFLSALNQLGAAEWKDLFGQVPTGTATMYFEDADRERRVMNVVDPSEPSGVGLIHLSDIHLGKGHRFTPPTAPGRLDNRPYLIERLGETELSPAGIVVSGDLLTAGDDNFYKDALRFLNDLSAHYNITKERIVVAPGNHDIPISESDPEDGYPKTAQFMGFLKQFYGTSTSIDRVHEFDGADGVHYVLGCVNSSQFRSRTMMDFGYVEESALAAVTREIGRRGRTQNAWRFLVMHHHIMTASVDEQVLRHDNSVRPVSVTVNGGHIVDRCAQFGIDAILRGHQHLPFVGFQSRTANVRPDHTDRRTFRDHPVLEMAAGSAGAESGMMDSLMNENSFSYYTINNESIKVHVFAYNDRVRTYPLDGWEFVTHRHSA